MPIIALTADAAPARRRFYAGADLSSFVTKPNRAAALRRELIAVPERGSSTGAQSSVEEVLDPERLAELTLALGFLKVRRLLELMLAELKERPATICAACAAGDLLRARIEAHSLGGVAANIGANGLGRWAKAVELALPGAELELATRRLDAEVRRAQEGITAMLNQRADPISQRA